MTEEIRPPVTVLKLAHKANGEPLAWNITEKTVTIVMRDGRKLTFDSIGAEEIRAEQPVPKRNNKK